MAISDLTSCILSCCEQRIVTLEAEQCTQLIPPPKHVTRSDASLLNCRKPLAENSQSCAAAHGTSVTATSTALLLQVVVYACNTNQPTSFMQALQDFEEVISMEPKNYLGDDFSRVTQIFRVAQYNLACCYSAIDQVRILSACSSWSTVQVSSFQKLQLLQRLDVLLMVLSP